ncbi:hypothetical protein [Streptomyces cylindrosporus]|uniref:Helix-turn-helix domain-containing protein n=1 Tax=Streptomyces cylindrosporus TaxID=2927583 RepID=A0ABS9YPJ2_9ACTN|nr:hypothetical protein [Streptomyces cylindrosporus]MCI3279183.1 hypothetical protein [Streptomyces cylindrosporus]
MSTTSAVDTSTFWPVLGAAQEVEHTASRWSAPRKWLTAVRWLIGSGLHPKANATTLRVAEDLAARMDYSTGHARYCEADMVARTSIPRATLYRHVGYLRELGALAYVRHGSRKNIRAAMGLKGYAATATEYAAVIPATYDHAMGHRIVGTGYRARIVIDMRNQAPKPVDTAGNPPVENPAEPGLETPSLTWVEEDGKRKVVGGSNYTSQQTASRDRASIPQQKSKSNSGSKSGRHALQVAQDIRIAAQVRPLVTWTQRVPLRPLAFCLRPLIDRGMDAYGIAAYLNGLCTGGRWRPRRPAAYIRTVLADRQQAGHKRDQEAVRYERENPVSGAFRATISAQHAFQAALKEGIALYQQQMSARGHEDLCTPHLAPAIEHTEEEAAADMAAFLGTNTVLTPAF